MSGKRLDLTTFDTLQRRTWEYLIKTRKAVFIDQQPDGTTRWLVPDGDHNVVAEYRQQALVGILDRDWAEFFQRLRRRETARVRKIQAMVDEYVEVVIREGNQHVEAEGLRRRVRDALQDYSEAVRTEVWRERRFAGEED